MIRIEFKTKGAIGPKKFHYAEVLAKIISEIRWFEKIIKRIDSDIELDYKIKLK